MTISTLAAARQRTLDLWPGLLVSLMVAAAANFLAEHYRAPLMLFALLLGMALNFLAQNDACKPGIEFASRTLLRIGVALLGIRITFEQIAAHLPDVLCVRALVD